METTSHMNLCEMIGITMVLTEFHSSYIQCCGAWFIGTIVFLCLVGGFAASIFWVVQEE